ncbi:polyhydroxyalkanoate synthesis regulator DNA-binding domain-containing protein [Streptomyces xanthochromogenes]
MTPRLPAAPAESRQRVLHRQISGELYDGVECRAVTLCELSQEVRAGRRFCVYEQATGTDCTYDVLGAVLNSATSRSVAALVCASLATAASQLSMR